MRRVKKIAKNTIICLLFIFTLILTVNASNDTFTSASPAFGKVTNENRQKLWWGTYDEIIDDTKYPFNTGKNAKFAFDLLYGVSKGLVVYSGEIPYEFSGAEDYSDLPFNSNLVNIDRKKNNGYVDPSNVKDGKVTEKIVFDDEIWGEIGLDDAEAVYNVHENSRTRNVSKVDGGCPDGSIKTGETPKWYKCKITSYTRTTVDVSESKNIPTKAELEEIARENKSLRLFALLNWVGPGVNVLAWLYNGVNAIVGLVAKLSTLIVYVKSLNGVEIIEAIGGEKILETVNRLFIGGFTSPYFILCVVGSILGLLSIARGYAKGGRAFGEIVHFIVVVVIAFVIIGMGSSNSVLKVGSSLADFTHQLALSVSGPNTTSGDIFITEDTGDTAKETELNEISRLNKIYIDTQIKNQFGVEVEELRIGQNYHLTTNMTGAVSTDFSVDDITQKPNIQNLGYTFWAYNSNYLLGDRTKVEATGDTKINKLSTIINYLQKEFNEGDKDKQTFILQLVNNLASPNYGAGIINLILVAVVYVMLIIVLARLSLKVVLGQFDILISVFGLPIAGPLLMVQDKKGTCLKAAKSIIYLFVVGMMKVTIYSIIFDLIITFTSALFKVEIINLLITLVFLFMIMKYIKVIQDKVDLIIENFERSHAQPLSNIRRQAKQLVKGELKKAERSEKGILKGTKEVVVGSHKDKYGNTVYETAKKATIAGRLARFSSSLLENEKIHEKHKEYIDQVSTKPSDMTRAVRLDTVEEKERPTVVENALGKYAGILNGQKTEMDTQLNSAVSQRYDGIDTILDKYKVNTIKDLSFHKLTDKELLSIAEKHNELKGNIDKFIGQRATLKKDYEEKVDRVNEAKKARLDDNLKDFDIKLGRHNTTEIELNGEKAETMSIFDKKYENEFKEAELNNEGNQLTEKQKLDIIRNKSVEDFKKVDKINTQLEDNRIEREHVLRERKKAEDEISEKYNKSIDKAHDELCENLATVSNVLDTNTTNKIMSEVMNDNTNKHTREFKQLAEARKETAKDIKTIEDSADKYGVYYKPVEGTEEYKPEEVKPKELTKDDIKRERTEELERAKQLHKENNAEEKEEVVKEEKTTQEYVPQQEDIRENEDEKLTEELNQDDVY